MNRTYNVSDQAREQYKKTSPVSWKKCKGDDSVLDQKICEKIEQGKVVRDKCNDGYTVIRYYFLNITVDLQRNDVIEISENKNQAPFHVWEKRPSRYERLKRRLIQRTYHIYRTIKSTFLYSISTNKYTANFDGSHRNGQLGIGFRITSSDGEVTIYEHSEAIQCKKSMDSSDAELIALIRLLEKVRELEIRSIKITGDCQGLIDVINFNYKVRPRLEKHMKTIRSLMGSSGIQISYANRKYNLAHKLSRHSIINQEG